MNNASDDRLDRIERILEAVAQREDQMAARQQYHDEAFERHDAEMKQIRDMLRTAAESISRLAAIAGAH